MALGSRGWIAARKLASGTGQRRGSLPRAQRGAVDVAQKVSSCGSPGPAPANEVPGHRLPSPPDEHRGALTLLRRARPRLRGDVVPRGVGPMPGLMIGSPDGSLIPAPDPQMRKSRAGGKARKGQSRTHDTRSSVLTDLTSAAALARLARNPVGGGTSGSRTVPTTCGLCPSSSPSLGSGIFSIIRGACL